MIESKYCDREDIECLVETLQDEDSKEDFFYGFMSAISFAHYKSLGKEGQELYCKEIFERVINGVGQELMQEFLEEHFGKIQEE